MQVQQSIDENVDDFLKIFGELSHLSIELPEEVQAVLLLNALPTRYDQLKETLKYSREAIKVEDVTSSAKSKEKEIKETFRVSSQLRRPLCSREIRFKKLVQ